MSALVFKTENSSYKLELCDQGFRVTKVGEVNENPAGIKLGFTRTSWCAHLTIGEPARFGGLTTTPVSDIMSFEQWEKEPVA